MTIVIINFFDYFGKHYVKSQELSKKCSKYLSRAPLLKISGLTSEVQHLSAVGLKQGVYNKRYKERLPFPRTAQENRHI